MLEIGGPGLQIDDQALFPGLGQGHNLHGFRSESPDQGLDGLGDRLRGRPAAGGRELEAVVLRGIVAGGNVDAPGTLGFPDGETHHRRGAIPGGEMAGDTVSRHHLGGGGGKGLGPEAGIVADRHSLMGQACLLQIAGNGLAHQTGIGEGEIFRQNAAPTRGSKFNFRHPGEFLLMQGSGVRDQGSEKQPNVTYSVCQKFFPLAESFKSPPPPFRKGGNYKELLLKSPFEKGGFGGFGKTSKRKEFMGNAIFPAGLPPGVKSQSSLIPGP